MRRLFRKIGRGAFGCLHLHLLARLDLDQGFRGRAILAVRFSPDLPPQNRDIIVKDGRRAGTRPAGLPVGELMGVVELVGAGARLHFEPAAPVVAA